MLSSGDAKYLAIAAACGIAVGAVAGAVGYATLSSTPSSSRRNSCSQCSPQHNSTSLSALVSANGDGVAQATMAGPEAAKLLEDLSNRMASLEEAVRKRLLSRSGTNSSLAGYLTARESSPGDSEDDDDFQDVSGDSSNGDDIFFQTSATVKKSKLRLDVAVVGSESSTSLHTADTVPSSDPVVDYSEIDRCLCSDVTEENNTAYDKLSCLKEMNSSLDSEPQFLWRFAKAVHQKNLASTAADSKKIFAFRAKELAFEALLYPGGDEIADVHKWCAITIGNLGDYVTLQEKISNGSVFKERIDYAIRLNNKDEMCFYLLGRWCYSIYMMTWVERKVATSLVSNFPSATINEALVAFQNSEGLKPGHWIDNQLFLAKCYIEKKDYSTALSWLDKARTLTVKPEDRESKQEVEMLLKKYSGYRKK